MKYAGLFKLAYKLLVNDRGKFSALLLGITFAVFLMVEMTSLFAGILTRSASTVTNVGSTMWIMDPAVQTVAASIPMPDYLLNAVRSIHGVRYAVPLYSGGAQVKLKDGTYQAVTVMGLDDTSLVGRPALEQGEIQNIYAENAFIVVDDAEYGKLGKPSIGTEFELNDHRGVIVGVAKVNSFGLFGLPTLYTTYRRATEYIPNPRFTTSYILAEPTDPQVIPHIEKEVAKLGYVALTKGEFELRIANFYKYQTGVGTNIMLMTVISFIVGLTISAQTFYTFVLENLDKFGALKAIGAKGYELTYMILFQVTFISLTGYGLGTGLCALMILVARLRLPDYAALITVPNLGLALGMVILIAAVSSYISIRKVLKVEPFDIFRG